MESSPSTASTPQSSTLFTEGMSYLRGIGVPQDHGMAAAKLLDASDMGHAEATFYAALIYFCGFGVTRNPASAREYALKYLQVAGDSEFKREAKEIAEGTLGTKNAEKLISSVPGIDAPVTRGSKRPSLLVLGGAAVVLIVAAVAAVLLFRGQSSLSPARMAADIKIEQLISQAETDQARKEAMTFASALVADAKLILQEKEKQRADAEAREKAQAEARAKAESEARARAEAQAREHAEAQARATQAAAARSQQSSQQSQGLLSAARAMAQRGEYDRALGVVDTILATDPNNREALGLRGQIKSVQARAVKGMVIR